MFFGVACPAGSSDTGHSGDGFAGAGGIVVRSSPETLGIRGVETVASGQTGDGGEDKAVTCLYCPTYGWGGFVAFRWSACRVGWVGGWGIVGADLCPHALFGCEHVPFLREGPRDVFLVPLELRFGERPRPIPFASPKGEGISGGGVEMYRNERSGIVCNVCVPVWFER